MNKCFTRLMLGLVAAATSLPSCEKVSSLNDSANIEKISVVSTVPSEIIIDTPVIDGHNISLPLVMASVSCIFQRVVAPLVATV